MNKLDDYADLGWMNSWSEFPKEYEECRKWGHKLTEISHSSIGCVTEYRCDICKIVYCVDSSG